jgi:hypothetical protein
MARGPEENRIYMQEYYKRNPLYRQDQIERAQEWQATHPDEHKFAIKRYRKRRRLAVQNIE